MYNTKEEFIKVKQGLEIVEKENALSESDKGYLEALRKCENLILCEVGVEFNGKEELSFIDWKYFETGIKEDKQWLINEKKLSDKQLREIYKIMKINQP